MSLNSGPLPAATTDKIIKDLINEWKAIIDAAFPLKAVDIDPSAIPAYIKSYFSDTKTEGGPFTLDDDLWHEAVDLEISTDDFDRPSMIAIDVSGLLSPAAGTGIMWAIQVQAGEVAYGEVEYHDTPLGPIFMLGSAQVIRDSELTHVRLYYKRNGADLVVASQSTIGVKLYELTGEIG